ncbi:MAG: hypothetical protein LBK03_01985 [Bacteroidales bacterium]|jgi:hypothetical protein|nr:hypothetical protein [Bacteroidales bacterium]
MKKATCILLLTLFTGTLLSAQEEKTVPTGFIVPKHEIGVSYGVFATPIILPFGGVLFPNINFDYYYNFNQRHAVGATLSLFFAPPTNYNPFGMVISPQVNYRISYCQRNANNFCFNLYSLASIGWKISTGSLSLADNWAMSSFALCPTIHVTFIGMRVGNQQDAAKIEFGWGTHGLIVVGYTHSFIRNKPSF